MTPAPLPPWLITALWWAGMGLVLALLGFDWIYSRITNNNSNTETP